MSLIAFLFIAVGVHFLYFVTGEDQVSVVCGVNLVRHQFCGVVDIAFMACVVFILFVRFLSLLYLFVNSLSSIEGGLVVKLGFTVDLLRGDIVGLSGTTHPFSCARLVVGQGRVGTEQGSGGHCSRSTAHRQSHYRLWSRSGFSGHGGDGGWFGLYPSSVFVVCGFWCVGVRSCLCGFAPGPFLVLPEK